MSMPNHAWSGIFPALCTPFAQDGALDEAAQRAVVRFALDCGADGLVCFGLAGEVNKLTPEERKRLSRVILDETDGRVPVLLGVGAEALHTSIDLTRDAQAVGASGVVVPPPLTAHVDRDGLAEYFIAVAAATVLPVVIQDAPEYLGVDVGADLVLRVAAAQPNVRYVKVETGPEGTAHWVDALAPKIGVFTGSAGLHLLGDLRAGVTGNVPGTEVIDLLVAMYRAEQAGNRTGADGLYRRLLPYLVYSLQGLDHYNACTKEVLVRRGVLPHGGLRQPGPRLSPVSAALLDGYVAELGLSPRT